MINMQALFKARFEQALDSQKLNIKKIEQQLRRMNINPDDPVAMASIQRVASTFFNAIDKKEGSPYVFQGEKHSGPGPATVNIKEPESGEDSDQEELDKFIAEIEDAADKEWEVEEAAEKEEVNRIRYLYREDYDGRYTKPGMGRMAPQRGGGSENDEVDDDGDEVDSDEGPSYDVPKVERWKSGKNGRAANGGRFNSRDEEESESEDVLDDLENIMFESDEENESKSSIKATNYENERKEKTTKNADEDWDSD
ncbi:putative CRM domain-containing protein [Helianthus annuus]|nr:putative CRM domain-containing protein [Helianthus annuus]